MNTLERLDAWLSLPEDGRMPLASVQTLVRKHIAPHAEHHDRRTAELYSKHFSLPQPVAASG